MEESTMVVNCELNLLNTAEPNDREVEAVAIGAGRDPDRVISEDRDPGHEVVKGRDPGRVRGGRGREVDPDRTMDQNRDLVPGQDLTAEVSGPNPTQSRGPDLVKMRKKNPKRNPKEVTDRIRKQEKIDPDQDPEETIGRIQNPKERKDHDPNL